MSAPPRFLPQEIEKAPARWAAITPFLNSWSASLIQAQLPVELETEFAFGGDLNSFALGQNFGTRFGSGSRQCADGRVFSPAGYGSDKGSTTATAMPSVQKTSSTKGNRVLGPIRGPPQW